MNDEIANSARDRSATSPAQSRCDNYEQYLEETYGYAYSARDIVSVQTLERHDHLVKSPTPEDLGITADDLDDFERLGLARGYERHGQLDAFSEQIWVLFESDAGHPAVAYPELPLLAALTLRSRKQYGEARSFLERGREKWPEATMPIDQQRALVALATDGREAARRIYETLVDEYPEDAELRYEIAEDLWKNGADEMAERWVDRAQSAAERLNDRPLMVDIRLLRQRLGE